MAHIRSSIIGLALIVVPTVGASAADLGLPLPPPLPVVQPCIGCTGPVYLKGFIGAANPTVGGIHSELFETNDFQVSHKDIKSSTLFGVGIGYEFNSWLRFDVTGEYRGSSLFIAQDRYPGGNGTFNRAGNDADGTFLPGTNEYTADIESWVGLANAYIDLGTYFCVTPLATAETIGAVLDAHAKGARRARPPVFGNEVGRTAAVFEASVLEGRQLIDPGRDEKAGAQHRARRDHHR